MGRPTPRSHAIRPRWPSLHPPCNARPGRMGRDDGIEGDEDEHGPIRNEYDWGWKDATHVRGTRDGNVNGPVRIHGDRRAREGERKERRGAMGWTDSVNVSFLLEGWDRTEEILQRRRRPNHPHRYEEIVFKEGKIVHPSFVSKRHRERCASAFSDHARNARYANDRRCDARRQRKLPNPASSPPRGTTPGTLAPQTKGFPRGGGGRQCFFSTHWSWGTAKNRTTSCRWSK